MPEIAFGEKTKARLAHTLAAACGAKLASCRAFLSRMNPEGCPAYSIVPPPECTRTFWAEHLSTIAKRPASPLPIRLAINYHNAASNQAPLRALCRKQLRARAFHRKIAL